MDAEPRGLIFLIDLDEQTRALFQRRLQGSYRVEAVPALDVALARVPQDEDVAIAVVVGAGDDAARVVQRIKAVGRTVPVLVVAEAQELPDVARALRFAPFIGDEVAWRSKSDGEVLVSELVDMLRRAAQRRRYRASVASANVRVADAGPRLGEPARYLDRLLDYAPIGIVAVDQDGRVTEWNRRAREILALGAPEAVGQRLLSLFPELAGAGLEAMLRDALAAGRTRGPEVLERRTPAGEPQHVEVTTGPLNSHDGHASALVLLEDVSTRVAAERARDVLLERERLAREEAEAARLELRRQLTFTRALTLSIGEGIYALDTLGRLTFMNPAAERLLGWTADELRGRQVHDLIHFQQADGTPAPAEACPVMQALRTGSPIRVDDDVYTRKDGSLLRISYASSPIELDGQVVGAVVAFFDMTEVRRIERQKDEFLAAVSHDLKNPLAAIKGIAQMLLRRAAHLPEPDGPRLADGLQTIDRTASRVTAMINHLLDAARLETGRPLELERQPTDLVELARQVAEEQVRASDRHRLALRTSAPSLVGAWDRGRLERVVSNLLSNALKYSPAGGEIVVSVREEEDGADRWAVLTVQDQGVGIPAEELPRVFERFYRASNVAARIEGSGVGLAGAKQIVEQHGGTICVESVEDAGTTFVVRLPLESGSRERPGPLTPTG